MNPLAIDLYCGLGGWAEGFLSEGWNVIGFDIERHNYGTGGYPAHLVLQDVLTLHGSQFKDASVIVASPPCQKYSYMAMPWKRAKALAKWYRANPVRIEELNALFNACFRIQHQAIEAAGRYIPIVVENVKGAQPWVGQAQAHFGSFYLWGDIGQVGSRVVAGPLEYGAGISPRMKIKNNGGSWFNVAHNTESGVGQNPDGRKLPAGNCSPRRRDEREVQRLADAVKVPGQDCSSFAKTGKVSPHWRMVGIKIASDSGRRTDVGNGVRFTSTDCGIEGIKQRGSGREWFAGEGKISRVTGSDSPKRKAASAEIAKIPFPLAQYIAQVFRARA